MQFVNTLLSCLLVAAFRILLSARISAQQYNGSREFVFLIYLDVFFWQNKQHFDNILDVLAILLFRCDFGRSSFDRS